MTEAEWLAATDPEPMRNFMWGKWSDRKERLFECACCRRVWAHLNDEGSRQAVIAGELHADGMMTEEEMITASGPASDAWDAEMGGALKNGTWDCLTAPFSAAAYNAAIPAGWWGGAPAFRVPSSVILEAAPN